MASIPFAFSVHHFINSVGAYAGFAAIIGLAILVLLYFAQARETSSLREQAYESAQRVQELENRIAQLARQPVPAPAPAVAPVGEPAVGRTGAPRPATAPARPATAVATVAALPEVGAPAGVGAPALTAATKLIPAGAVAAGLEEFTGEEPDLTTVGSPAPATVAGGANGHATMPPPVGAPADAQRPAVGEQTVPPRMQIRPSAASIPGGRRTPPPPRKQAAQGPSRGRRLLLGVLGLLVVAGIVVALFVITNSGSKSTNGSQQAANKTGANNTTAARRKRKQSATISPSSVTVSVLNGTATAQLAHRVSTKLNGLGYKEGTVATAADQTRTATVVAYLPGHQRDALAVANSLKLGPASVQPIDQSTQAVACPPGTACAAGVVVTVGSDLANIQ
jgi:hypothetical protein